MRGDDSLEQVIEGESKMLLINQLFVEFGQHLQEILLPLFLGILSLFQQILVDFLVFLLLLNRIEFRFLLIPRRFIQCRHYLLLRLCQLRADRLDDILLLVTEDISEGLLVILVEQLSNLPHQLLRHIIIMGCEVVSVYNDEIIGKIGFPQALIEDLIDRDYRQLQPLVKTKEITSKIKHLYGFTQSFAITKLFFTIIVQLECIVYVAGRFIVIEEINSKKQKIITNPQYISAFTVVDKLCLVGLLGGTLLLWDLEFLQTKLEILLPENSTTVSTVGLTTKFIFATDSSTPNNIAYCYDLRTAQLISAKVIPSIEPSVKGIGLDENMHATACADGIWILRVEKKQMEVIKGMFGRFPKTSICCLAKAGEYLVGGGVDGYIYVWKIKTLRCCRALKVSDSEVVSIAAKGKYIVLGCLNGRMKVYTFEVKKKEKKQYAIDLAQGEQEDEDDEEFAFIVVDSFQKQGSTVAIATSVLDPYLYYCMTRQGLIYEKLLPAPTSERKKISMRSGNETILRVNTSGRLSLDQSTLISAYSTSQALMIDVYSIGSQVLKLEQERTVLVGQQCGNMLAYSSSTEEIVYVTKSNKICVGATFNKVVEAVSHENKSDIGSNTQQLSQIQNEQILSINFVQHLLHKLLCVTTNESVWIYQRTGKLCYEEIKHVKYELSVPSPLKLPELQLELIYDERCREWMKAGEQGSILSQEEISHYEAVHTSKLHSRNQKWMQQKITSSMGFIIFWK